MPALIDSRFSNSRMANIEYLVTDVRRSEPPAVLFEVPGDYTKKDSSFADPYRRFYSRDHPAAQAR